MAIINQNRNTIRIFTPEVVSRLAEENAARRNALYPELVRIVQAPVAPLKRKIRKLPAL